LAGLLEKRKSGYTSFAQSIPIGQPSALNARNRNELAEGTKIASRVQAANIEIPGRVQQVRADHAAFRAMAEHRMLNTPLPTKSNGIRASRCETSGLTEGQSTGIRNIVRAPVATNSPIEIVRLCVNLRQNVRNAMTSLVYISEVGRRLQAELLSLETDSTSFT